MQLPIRSSFEHCYLFPELKNEVFQLHMETKFPQKFFSVPFLSTNGTPVRRGRCQLDLKHADILISVHAGTSAGLTQDMGGGGGFFSFKHLVKIFFNPFG